MAFRLVKAATGPAAWYRPADASRGHEDKAADELRGVLRGAFPVEASDQFQQLLEAVDQKTRHR